MFESKIATLIKTGKIKSHAKCVGVEIPHLANRHLIVTQDGSTLKIKVGRYEASFELTKSRSGSLYCHWIRLNKCLISIHTELSKFEEVEKPTFSKESFEDIQKALDWLKSHPDYKYQDIDLLGLDRCYRDDTDKLSMKVLKKQYRTISRALHPDMPQGNAETFLRLKRAYNNYAYLISDQSNDDFMAMQMDAIPVKDWPLEIQIKEFFAPEPSGVMIEEA